MEPFSVTCETCRARLKVRDASVIGEIHACPKCESMVLIVPPAGWHDSKSVAVATETAGPTAEFAHVTPPSEDAADAFAAAAALAARPDPESVPAASIAESASAMSLPTASAPPASAVASSKLLVGSLAGCVVLLLGGFAWTMLSGGVGAESQSSPPIVATTGNMVDSQEIATADSASPAAQAESEAVEDRSRPEEVIAAKPASEPVVESTVDAPVESLQSSADIPVLRDEQTSTETAAVATAVNVESNLANDLQPPAPTPIDNPRAPVLKFDPLDFDPSQLSLGGSTATTAETINNSVADEQADAADTTIAAREVRSESADLLPPAENPSVTVRLGPMVRDEAAAQNTTKSLALRVDSFTATAMPLERFIALVSDMAGVSITLDPEALALAGVSPDNAVTVNATDVTLAQLLSDVLSKQRLELVESAGHVRIALANGAERSTKTHDVEDLVEAGATDARPIAELIEQFVSPTTWQTGGGTGTIQVDGGKLRVEQSKSVHHDIVAFCERLRLARGLRQRTRYPAHRLSLESTDRKLDAMLSERTTFTFLPWTRLADVVRHWEQQMGVTILVDWSSLADAEITPSTSIACSAVDRSWGESLHEVLEPIGLAWWPVDHGTIQITTQDVLGEIQRTEFHLVPPSLRTQADSGAALVESLASELREQTAHDDASGERLQISFDQSSGRLIVRGTPRTHRYLSERLHGVEEK